MIIKFVYPTLISKATDTQIDSICIFEVYAKDVLRKT